MALHRGCWFLARDSSDSDPSPGPIQVFLFFENRKVRDTMSTAQPLMLITFSLSLYVCVFKPQPPKTDFWLLPLSSISPVLGPINLPPTISPAQKCRGWMAILAGGKGKFYACTAGQRKGGISLRAALAPLRFWAYPPQKTLAVYSKLYRQK